MNQPRPDQDVLVNQVTNPKFSQNIPLKSSKSTNYPNSIPSQVVASNYPHFTSYQIQSDKDNINDLSTHHQSRSVARASLQSSVPPEIADKIKEEIKVDLPEQQVPNESHSPHIISLILIGIAIFLTGMGITMLILLI